MLILWANPRNLADSLPEMLKFGLKYTFQLP